MLGKVAMSSMDTPPLDRGQQAFFKAKLEKGKGIRGKGMGLALKPLDGLTPYGTRLRHGFALLRAGE